MNRTNSFIIVGLLFIIPVLQNHVHGQYTESSEAATLEKLLREAKEKLRQAQSQSSYSEETTTKQPSQSQSQVTDISTQQQSTQEVWKTYFNPKYGFTIKYPSSYFDKAYESTSHDNMTEFDLTTKDNSILISIIPVNISSSVSKDAFSLAKDRYVNDAKYGSIIENITEVKYGGLPAYTIAFYEGDGMDDCCILKYAYLQHNDQLYHYYLFNSDRTNYLGDLFNNIVNSTTFMD